ncbi:inorganic phosphate transporter [Azoarcus communis]|uniref:Inorganic phosphate transporter n=1 Tax=Parazoarcus communis SWub3 = DSM 12120 TaxID=1121029 RepID=A0A323V4U3_9RHOO|nr:inorganic phosphate transporter [Parazoarcus communis]NMG48639.1 inorganic phosphate transporter [Parazoarcus communis]NMG69221.1 inorganic phosphate transporter [Parazoarcus communis SWub3 = DSM 12120]PZA18466.1 inorganic phosphate transporter [Azoarcus communis] [Parazoarcus communis SWub3 = DSM 12120]
MEPVFVLAIAAVVTVLVFDYTNGFHDAANVVATVIASRAMSPAQAVALVAVFEFLGPLLGGTAVANTIGGFINLGDVPVVLSLGVLVAGLLGAICWNLLTWWWGIPSSSSHALVGGLVGAVVLAVGVDHVQWGFGELAQGRLTGVTKVLLALVLSPVLGFVVGYLLHRLLSLIFRAARPVLNRYLRLAQYVTTAGLAFSHGANDAQKSMGILTLVLVLGGFIPKFEVPFWVMLACAMAMTAGILSGGWRIVRTLGFAVYKVRPLHALDSQLTSAAVIFSASLAGAPVSTSHVVASSIMGIGASERPRSVRWGKAGEIAATWLITLPASAAAGAVLLLGLRIFLD